MPQLKQIEASIELGTSNTKLNEYGARYSDGHVETFIAVPDTDMPFSIHIRTHGYIAPGISFFVYMDGQYQCNRNKIGFKLPGDGVQPKDYEAEFRMRQKEEKTGGGSFLAREWSFAKLNTVAADKAPSLNPDFYKNVGTIEIVAMRCRPASEESAVRRKPFSQAPKKNESAQKAASNASRAKPAKQPTPAASKAPSKAGSGEKDDMLGGLLRLFDGACDEIGLDGAGDERPAVTTPLGYRRPYVEDANSATPHGGQANSATSQGRLKGFMGAAVNAVQTGQMDSRGHFPSPSPNPRANQQGDDLRGDRYLGMDGQDRWDYKQFFRERGDTVSQTPRPATGLGIMQGFICNTPAAAQQMQKTPDAAKYSTRFFIAARNDGHYEFSPAGAKLLETDLEAMKKDLQEQKRAHPDIDMDEEWRDWRLLDAQLQSMYAHGQQQQVQYGEQQLPVQTFRTGREEALDDLHNLRKEIKASAAAHPTLDVNRLMSLLNMQESRIKSDAVFSDVGHPDLDGEQRQLHDQLLERHRVLQNVLNALREVEPQRPSGGIENKICEIRAILQDIGIAPQTPKAPTPGRHVDFPQGYDGPHFPRNANPTTPAQPSGWSQNATPAQNADWAQVGGGTWGGTQKAEKALGGSQTPGNAWGEPKHPSTHEHFPGEKLQKAGPKSGDRQSQSGWPAGGAGGDPWGDAQQNANDGWGSGASGGQQAQNAWDSAGPAASRASNQHDNNGGTGWGPNPSKQGSGTKQNGSSQRAAGGGDDRANQGTQGAGWGGQSNKSQANNGVWGNNDQKSNANGSRSGGRGAAPESLASNPTNFIKPYWKDWNKPTSGSPDLGRKRETPREVYTYPAQKLPSIPEGKVSTATHGIAAGRGASYQHITNKPMYIDSLDKPYAVFSFKYRSKEKLKQITRLDVKTVDEDIKTVQKQMQKGKLMQLPKDQLIEQLMKSSERKGGSTKAPSAAGGQGWGARPASNAGSKPKSAAGGWGADNNGNDHQWNAGGSNHCKSKKNGADDWNGGQAQVWEGNAAGWDGQNEAEQEQFKSSAARVENNDAGGAVNPGSPMFNYDAFRNVEHASSVVGGADGKNTKGGHCQSGDKDWVNDNTWW